MQFECDPEEARRNLAKHNVAFDDATFVWDDPLYGLYRDRVVDGEARWHVIGMVGGTLLVVVHSYPDGEEGGRVRIIGDERRHGMKDETMKRELTAEQIERLKKVAAMPEEVIDTDDIP